MSIARSTFIIDEDGFITKRFQKIRMKGHAESNIQNFMEEVRP